MPKYKYGLILKKVQKRDRDTKNDVWKDITEALANACPQALAKNIFQIKRKYNNTKWAAVEDIKLYNKSIHGTGNGI